MIRLSGLLTIALFLLSGCCGYHSLRQNSHFPADTIVSTHIRLFENKSYRAGLDTRLGTALVDVYAKHSGGMVATEENAQLVLSGLLLSYETAPVSYTAADKIREYRARIVVSAVLQRSKTMEVLWKAQLYQEQIFPANADIAFQKNAEDAAILELCRKLALDIWRKSNEEF